MYDQHYLHYFDDSHIAGDVADAIKENFNPREFTESGYIPVMLTTHAQMVFDYVAEQGAKIVYDIYCRVFTLFGQECPFTQEEFSVEGYTFGDFLELKVMDLPKTGVVSGSFLKMVLFRDIRDGKFYFAQISKGDEDCYWIYTFDLYGHQWNLEEAASEDPEDVLYQLVSIVVNKIEQDQYLYVTNACPLCGASSQLGLTEEEMEGYRRYQTEDEDLEDAIPALNAFEREFLITGICLDCQCRVFGKDAPRDVSRWRL